MQKVHRRKKKKEKKKRDFTFFQKNYPHITFIHAKGDGRSARSAHGVMVIVVGYGHGDMSSNPGRD